MAIMTVVLSGTLIQPALAQTPNNSPRATVLTQLRSGRALPAVVTEVSGRGCHADTVITDNYGMLNIYGRTGSSCMVKAPRSKYYSGRMRYLLGRRIRRVYIQAGGGHVTFDYR